MRRSHLFHGRWIMAAPIYAGTIAFASDVISTLVTRLKKVAMVKSLSILVVVTLALVAMPECAVAGFIFTPGATIFGGEKTTNGFDIIEDSSGGEGVSQVIDGVGQKYFTPGSANRGFIVTPSIGSSVATSIRVWTANDRVERDPASYELWGSNAAIGTGPSFSLTDFNLISSGALSLPSARNDGGNTPLSDDSSEKIDFVNSTAYTSYMVIFPTVKNSGDGLQLAEVQLYGSAAVPEPTSLAIFGIIAGIAGLKARTRKRAV